MRTRGKYSLVSDRRMVLLLGLLLLGGCWSCAAKTEPPKIPVGSVHISPTLLDYFDRWHGEDTVERVVALYGRRRGMVVYVEGFDATHALRADSVSVQYRIHEPTSRRIVGTLHTHPTRPDGFPCAPSDTDLRTLYRSPYLIAMVACGEGKFGFVLRGDPDYHRIRGR